MGSLIQIVPTYLKFFEGYFVAKISSIKLIKKYALKLSLRYIFLSANFKEIA